ncbi:hypothetical protein HII31_08169 [Pseudocercospora fuligena]|uniref:DUF7605 domain-containing protein n=1 Tax=Pseudocercospora fuligena TaxID=685502 RepID=A0A8H6REP1_9PEZI|nr:hypothetical protein HII31_08169 [Pseudocercospora fuligena]
MTTLGKRLRTDDSTQEFDTQYMYKQDDLVEPEHAAYSDDNKAAEQLLSETVHELLNVLRWLFLQYGIEQVEFLIQQVEATCSKPDAEKPIIAICGPTGAGKSAFIINLLNVLGITRSVSGGSSVTCLPTTYTFQLQGQKLDFAAEMESMTEPRLATFFRELISDIRRFYGGQVGATSAGWTTEDKADYEERASTGLKMINVLLDGKKEWSSKDKIIRRCSAAVSDNDLTALTNELVECSRETLIQHGFTDSGGSFLLRVESDTAPGLQDRMCKYVYENDGRSPGQSELWPVLRRAKVGCRRAPILNFIDIRDCTGSNDTNRIRGEIASENIQECQVLWALCDASRAASNPAFLRLFSGHVQQFGQNIMPVITHVDLGLNDALAGVMEKAGYDLTVYKRNSQAKMRLENQLTNIEAELEQVKACGRAGESASQKSAHKSVQKKLKAQKSDAEDKLRDLQTECRDALAAVREQSLKDKLVAARPEPFRDRAILFAANEDYKHHKERSRVEKMSLEKTNIPKLRTMSMQVGGDATHRNNRAYMLRILSVMDLARILVDKARPSALHGLVTKFSADMDALHAVDSAPNCADRFAQDLATDLEIFANHSLQLGRFVTAAVAANSEAYRVLHASVFRAVVVRHGLYRRIKGETEHVTDLNEDMMVALVQAINVRWDRALARQLEILDQVIDNVIAAIVAMDERIKALPHSEPIHDMLIIAIEHIRNLRQASKDGLEEELRILLENATTSELGTGYFVQAMQPIYEIAETENGTGCTNRMRQDIDDGLIDNETNPFVITCNAIKTAHRHAAEKHVNKLHANLKSITDGLIDGLRRASDVKHRTKEEKETWKVIGNFLSENNEEIQQAKNLLKVDQEELRQELEKFAVQQPEEPEVEQNGAASWLSGLLRSFLSAGRK